MSHKDCISILIVTHNHKDFIKKLLDSLEKFEYTNVFICDAASTDGTQHILRDSKFNKKVIEKSKLESFSKNNNDLIRHFNLSSEYYLLLNPDLYFNEDFIIKLHNVAKSDSSFGIVAPEVHYPDGKLQITWKKFPSVIQVFKKRVGLISTKNEIQMLDREIDWCLGACMLINKQFLKKGGSLLDERYRLYCEDVDICFEAHQRNLKVIGEKNAVVYHHLNELSSKRIFSKYNYWNICSIFKFALKWNYKYFANKK